MLTLNTTVRRGRPPATHANDNNEAYAERADAVRSMRQEGMTFRAIADKLAIDARTVRRAVSIPQTQRPPLAANDNKVVRTVPHNGGWSTNSGRVAVSLPRVPTLDLPEIKVAA